jgi:hypothetical protein
MVPEGVPVLHPAFDVTPHALVTAIVTERGVARDPYGKALAALCAAAGTTAGASGAAAGGSRPAAGPGKGPRST